MQCENLQKIVELRHILHRKAELSLHEAETGRILRDFLRRNTSLEIVERDGWFYAVKQGRMAAEGMSSHLNSEMPAIQPEKPSDTIAFRADMDALPIEEGIDLPYASVNPGVSHKCGHDGHCAALCGLALELENRQTDRPVYFIFQKAEEIGAGGAPAAELIGEKGIREIYAFHNLSGYPEKSLVYRRGLTQPASQGIRTEVQISDRFPETKNSDAGIDRVLAAAKRLGVPCASMEEMWRASEDFGHYLKKCGGAMFYIGNGAEWPALHTAEYDFNDRILETAVDLFAGLAVD